MPYILPWDANPEEDEVGRRKVISFVDAVTLARAEVDLNSLPQGKTALRLLAILAVGQDRQLEEVSQFFRTTRQTVAAWVHRYKKGGVALLEDRPKGHRVARLGESERRVVARWIETGVDGAGTPTHWTVDHLRTAIEEKFGVRFGKTRVWQLLRTWGYALKVPRPRHEKADPKAERAFKKTPREIPGPAKTTRRKR